MGIRVSTDNFEFAYKAVTDPDLDDTTLLTLTTAGNMTITGDLTITGGNITNAVTFDSGITNAGTIAASTLTNPTINAAALSGTFTGTPTFSGGALTLTSSSASEPILHITNTDAGATSGELRFNKDSASGADDDVMGMISFYGTDSGNNTHQRLAYMDSIITDSAHGSESSSLRFYVAETGTTLTAGLTIAGQPDNDGEVDVTIGAGAASTTTIAGTLTMGSTATLTNAGLVAVANQSNITGVGTITSGTWQGTTIAVDQGGTGATTLNDLITL